MAWLAVGCFVLGLFPTSFLLMLNRVGRLADRARALRSEALAIELAVAGADRVGAGKLQPDRVPGGDRRR